MRATVGGSVEGDWGGVWGRRWAAGLRSGSGRSGVPAVVGSVRLDAAALGTFVHHLPGLQL